MGAKLREVRRRIRSVQSTMKITRAMELIATSRIVKAQQRVEQARPYAERLTAAIADVASATSNLGHPLLQDRPDRRSAGVFVVTSDRGLAGAYSSNVLKRAEARRFVPMVLETVERPAERGPMPQYIFEPEPEKLLGELLPRYIETRVYNALLEAAAAEHAARRRAMSAATDNADELIKVLTRVANQARQTEITTEITEIVGGAEALRQAREAAAS